jgi:hypothetical protein
MTDYITREHPAAYWISANPVLNLNQKGTETDTGAQKRGDGATPWNELLYFTNSDQGGKGSGISANFGSITNVRQDQTVFIPEDYESVVSQMTISGILTTDGTLTLL